MLQCLRLLGRYYTVFPASNDPGSGRAAPFPVSWISLLAPAYDAADLCADVERFSFFLGGNGGEHLLA